MVQTLSRFGALQVASPAATTAAIRAQDEQKAAAAASAAGEPVMTSLASHIRTLFETFKRHRSSQAGWDQRLLAALRSFNGQYDPAKLAEITKFGGSTVYARTTAMKCRGASSLLRDVFLSPDRPWGVSAPADPDVPDEIAQSVMQLVQGELQNMQAAGQPVGVEQIRDRTLYVMEAAKQAARKQASKRAKLAEDRLDEILTEGGFYKALSQFLVDLPLFPFAVIKGPVVRIVPQVTWQGSRPTIMQKPRLFWERVSPFDIWWTPGVSEIEAAEVIERLRFTRADLNDLLDLPGYNHDAVRAVLDEYGRGGLSDSWDGTDSERAVQESRENPVFNQSGLITGLEYHGNIQGRMLIEYGMDPSMIHDELRDYMVQAWLIGRHVIKVQMSPSPRKRHPYYVTSFEKVPGTVVGNALPDILDDVQEVTSATLRALVNNLSMASGPQVVIDMSRLAPDEDPEEMFPWKRWRVQSDFTPGNSTQEPISFFQPESNAQALLAVYQAFNSMADDLSAIPKYATGQAPGGAGRTASGLAMLMGNASKILQTVAANVDIDVMDPCLTGLFDLIMLTDTTGLLAGDEAIVVKGVNVAIQRETQRARQLELLQVTANPIDMAIVGQKGRAGMLRSVSQGCGFDGDSIVPSEHEIEAQEQAQQMAMQQQQAQDPMAQQAAVAQGTQQGPAGTADMGPRTAMAQPRIAGGVG